MIGSLRVVGASSWVMIKGDYCRIIHLIFRCDRSHIALDSFLIASVTYVTM